MVIYNDIIIIYYTLLLYFIYVYIKIYIILLVQFLWRTLTRTLNKDTTGLLFQTFPSNMILTQILPGGFTLKVNEKPRLFFTTIKILYQCEHYQNVGDMKSHIQTD